MRLLASLALVLVLSASPAVAQLPALRDRPLSAAERVRLASLEGQFGRISAQRNTSVAALRTIARAMGRRLTTEDPDAILEAIDERAQELSGARARITALESQLETLDSARLARAVSPLLERATAAIDEGRLDDAEGLLTQAGERFSEARAGLSGQLEQLSAREAEVLGQRAAIRLAVFDYAGAATLLGQAAEVTPASQPQARWRWLHQQSRVLWDLGRFENREAELRQAIAVLERALPLAPRSERLADWSATRRRYGAVLSTIAEVTGDAGVSREAAAVFGEVLAAQSRTDDPDAWGQAQIGVADAMLALHAAGDRDPAVLAAAMSALEAASEVLQPVNVRAWLIARSQLGEVLLMRAATTAERVSAAEEVAGVTRAALPFAVGESTRDVRADLNDLRARALLTWGLAGADAARVAEADAAAAAALEESPRAEAAVWWAQRSVLRAQTLTGRARLAGAAGAPLLDEALRHLQAAGEVITAERWPDRWPTLQQAISDARAARAARVSGAAVAGEG